MLFQHYANSVRCGLVLDYTCSHRPQNILSIFDSSQQRLCWIFNFDEYGPELHYVEGPRNVIADTFSRLFAQQRELTLSGEESRLC
jgi:hypothetical protein